MGNFPARIGAGNSSFKLDDGVESVIRIARKIGDPIMIQLMELDTNIMGTSNFQNITLATPSGGYNAISQYQKLDYDALDYLVKIQPEDKATLEQKMQFLVSLRVGTPDRPYWTNLYEWKDLLYNNKTPFDFRFGTIVFGGQPLRVRSNGGVPIEHKFMAKYHGYANATMNTFYEVVGLRKKDWDRPVSELRKEGLIQIGTWATKITNKYNELWYSGTTLHPVWSHLDYPVNATSSPLYIDKKFVE